MPEELVGLEPAEQQRRLMRMSFTTMGIGTLLVVLFSDPMTGAASGAPRYPTQPVRAHRGR